MKILLIEDNKDRFEEFKDNYKIDFLSPKYNNIIDVAINERYFEVYEELETNTFDFDDYSIIIAHKSAFRKNNNNQEIIKKLEKESKNLVLFSGGIDVNYYSKDENKEKLELNSKTFYSNHLIQFLDSCNNGEKNNILLLCYGNKWKLNIALNIVEEVNRIINETDDKEVDCEDIVNDESKEILDEIDNDLYDKINTSTAKKGELTDAIDQILSYVDERLLYE